MRVILVKSFARIHETNLKKQGMLAVTFANESDYNKIQEDDTIDFIDLANFAPDKQLTVVLNHSNGTKDTIKVNHSYNAGQIGWFKAGSALNLIAKAPAGKARSSKTGKKKPARKVVKAVTKQAKKAKAAAKKAGKAAKKVAKKVSRKAVKKAKTLVKKASKKVTAARKKVKQKVKKVTNRKPVKRRR